MRTASVSRFFISIVVLANYAVSAHAGLQVETMNRNKTTGKEEAAQSIQIQDGKARIESKGARGTLAIFKDDTIYILDTQRKTYMSMDRATMEQTANVMSDAMDKMRAQMANMPPEQRAMIENMMKQRGMSAAPNTASTAKPIVLDAVATNASENVEGRNCKIWNVTRDGALVNQICVVSLIGLPGKDEFQAVTEKMNAIIEKLSNSIVQQFVGNPWQQNSSVAHKINGVPFITRRYRDGVLEPEELFIKSWKVQNIAATQFDIPTDFVKQEIPVIGQPKRTQ